MHRAAGIVALLVLSLTTRESAGELQFSDILVHTGRKPKLVERDHSLTISIPDIASVEGDKRYSNSSYWFLSIPSGNYHLRNTILFVAHPSGKPTRISISGHYWENDYRWASEHLLLVRIYWARHWGGDYIFDARQRRFIYSEEFERKRE